MKAYFAVILAGICAAAALAATEVRQRGLPGAATPRPTVAKGAPLPVPPTVIGMNTGSPDYWSAEWPFIDLVKSNGTLLLIDATHNWSPVAGLVQLNARGFPVGVRHDQTIVIMMAGGVPHMPPGPLQCSVSPGWDVKFFGSGSMSHQSGNRFQVDLKDGPPPITLALQLTPKGATADLTQASCVMAGGNAASGPFNPAFLADMKPFRVIRYMDWMRTNNASRRLWAERSTPDSFSQAGDQGAAVEYMVDLANRLGSDPWFTLPLDVDDDYYRNFATYVRDHLAPGRKAYVELSNEVWNSAFQQGKDAIARGRAAGYSSDDNLAFAQYYGRRVKSLMETWTAVFGGSSRLVRVVASQAAYPDRSAQILAVDGLDKVVDALAIAPYFGEQDVGALAPGQSPVDKALADGPGLIDQDIQWSLQHKATAAQHGLRLITYEGGQHYNSYTDALRGTFLTVNQDPRIGNLYHQYLRRWRKEVGGTIVLFDGISTPGPGGSFGHKSYVGQPLSEAPKMTAVLEEVGK